MTKKFEAKKHSAATLVNEWLNRTNRRKLNTGAGYCARNDFDLCARYWHKHGVYKLATTYQRAFQRLVEHGFINVKAKKPGKVHLAERPTKRVVKFRHDRDRNGNPYRRSSYHHHRWL